MKTLLVVFSLAIGLISGVVVTTWFPEILPIEPKGETAVSTEPKPLYWVAPMDPNFRRDKPGKSPMGMDLVPVYEEKGGADDGPGTIKISPEVVNNLGVRTGNVVLRQSMQTIDTVGYVQYNEDSLVHIHPRIEGWIEKLYVSAEGDPVTKDQPLYDIYSQELINAQEELLLALNQRSERLKRSAIRKLRLLHVPERAIKQLLKSRTVTENITFYAPQSGVIDNLVIRDGFYVKPETTLMSIGALDEVWVEAEVFEKQAGMVHIGAEVVMTLDYFPGRTWAGKIDYIYPSLEEMTRTLKVRIRFENEDLLLKPNMFASITISASDDSMRLMIPRESVIRTAKQDRVVLALGEGKFKSIAVTLGRLDQHYVEVLEGLSEGDEVVTSAQFLLDSESSKNSDFKRMSAMTNDSGSGIANELDNQPSIEWANATIESIEIMGSMAMVGVTHEAIDAWGWPHMYMDFPVVESVDVSALSVGQALRIEITKYPDNRYEISNVDTSADNHSALETGTSAPSEHKGHK